MNRLTCFVPVPILFMILAIPTPARSQGKVQYKDSIVYRITFRDTTIYRYDTVRINHYIHSDTIRDQHTAGPAAGGYRERKGLFNHDSWGIGPMVGAYYSPYHGFDVNIGFGVQYYLFSVPSFRNPHMGARGKKVGRH